MSSKAHFRWMIFFVAFAGANFANCITGICSRLDGQNFDEALIGFVFLMGLLMVRGAIQAYGNFLKTQEQESE